MFACTPNFTLLCFSHESIYSPPISALQVDVEASVEVDTPTEEEDPAFEMPEFEMPDFSDLAEEISAKFEEAKEALAKMFEE